MHIWAYRTLVNLIFSLSGGPTCMLQSVYISSTIVVINLSSVLQPSHILLRILIRFNFNICQFSASWIA